MLLSLLVAVFVVVHGSNAAPHGSGGIETIHYDQQQHATGNNVRLNMNKILVAILPLEDALTGLGLGGQFGSSDYDDHFTDLTLDDLKPPPPPPASSSESEPEVEEAETSEATAEAVPSEELTSGTEEPDKQQAHGVRISNKASSGVTCTRADVAAGRRCKRQRRSVA